MPSTKLNDLQLILLSTASQRDDGSVLPPADSITKDEKRLRAAISQLLRRGLIEEVPIKDRRMAWREEADQPLGVAITAAGRATIAPEEDVDQAAPETEPTNKNVSAATRPATKASLVLDLLGRPNGATLAELVDATGWLPHTTRAALTGLRKKGHVVEKSKRDDATCYRIAEVA
jgi:DNA-binding transcriptional regulator PaaX